MSDTIELCLDEIIVNEQARKHFDLTELRALGANILEHGLYNPLLVKRLGDRYVLVAGERRKRAMDLAGIKKAEAIILPDDAVFVNGFNGNGHDCDPPGESKTPAVVYRRRRRDEMAAAARAGQEERKAADEFSPPTLRGFVQWCADL